MRLHRPYIPWSVRETVIDRQMAAYMSPTWAIKYVGSAEKRVRLKLEEFFAGRPVHLHHRPALVNREIVMVKYDEYPGTGAWMTGALNERNFPIVMRYEPCANDPDYLIYLLAGAGEEHDVETRVHGLHGQHSDLALARKRRRKERKAKRPKRKWPKRKFPRARGRFLLTPGRSRGSRAMREIRGR